MKHCNPELNSRQELQRIVYEITELRNALLEDGLLDVPLLSNHHFYAGMEALLTAASEINQLRALASPIFLLDLEKDRKEVAV